MIRTYNGIQPTVPDSAFVDAAALVLGEVTLGEESSIWPMTVLRGDVNRIEVGPRSNIQDGTVVHVAHDGPFCPGGFPAIIGADVTVGHRAVIHACTVGDRVLVGMGAVIMDGATVGDDSIIGANALVPPGKALPGGYLYVGSPAKAARPLTDRELEHLRYSAAHYVRLAASHRDPG